MIRLSSFFLSSIITTLLLIVTIAPPAYAQNSNPCADLEILNNINCSGSAPLVSVFVYLSQIITGLIIAAAVIIVVVAGYMYMTAGGDGSKVETAKTMIKAALLGIILALGAILILRTISPQFTPTEDPKLLLPS